ncbi:maltokinase [Streptomyces sp. NPDC048442]|uniref:maltokinase N-terminal cap-like domain-containing protein n=1 Tax=Streptomyces sp. NPDC048442 TaxID=3154823 RepID=UPI003449CDB4
MDATPEAASASPPASPLISPLTSPLTSPPLPHASSALLASLAPLLHAWLPRQRWFAGKGRPVTGFALVSATELLPLTGSPGLLHLLVRAQQPSASPQGPGAPPPADCYQLFLGVRRSLPPALAPALIGRVQEGLLAGYTVYEGLADPKLAGLLLERLRVPGTLGSLRFDKAPDALPPAGLTARPLDAEQSNSSLVYGNSYILKIFRRIHPGANPDLELPLALTHERCVRVPAPVAWFEGANPEDLFEPFTLGLLQPFLDGAQDGWQRALDSLSVGWEFAPEARELGQVVAEVHTALAAALPTLTLGRPQVAVVADRMTESLETAAQAVPALLPYAPGLRSAFDAVRKLGGAGPVVTAQRIHGDLHLGQTLHGRDGEWSVIDFEGEPAKPITERRHPQPVLRDVAGMLRSFDYAARMSRPWNPEWADRCRAAFCEGYAAASGTDPRELPVLLRAYETDKAVYEVLYEARHRPSWLPVPMAAVRRLANFPSTEAR